ncbi:MAG: hypothetical protein WCJ97_02140 [Phycisphaerae bacterium]
MRMLWQNGKSSKWAWSRNWSLRWRGVMGLLMGLGLGSTLPAQITPVPIDWRVQIVEETEIIDSPTPRYAPVNFAGKPEITVKGTTFLAGGPLGSNEQPTQSGHSSTVWRRFCDGTDYYPTPRYVQIQDRETFLRSLAQPQELSPTWVVSNHSYVGSVRKTGSDADYIRLMNDYARIRVVTVAATSGGNDILPLFWNAPNTLAVRGLQQFRPDTVTGNKNYADLWVGGDLTASFGSALVAGYAWTLLHDLHTQTPSITPDAESRSMIIRAALLTSASKEATGKIIKGWQRDLPNGMDIQAGVGEVRLDRARKLIRSRPGGDRGWYVDQADSQSRVRMDINLNRFPGLVATVVWNAAVSDPAHPILPTKFTLWRQKLNREWVQIANATYQAEGNLGVLHIYGPAPVDPGPYELRVEGLPRVGTKVAIAYLCDDPVFITPRPVAATQAQTQPDTTTPDYAPTWIETYRYYIASVLALLGLLLLWKAWRSRIPTVAETEPEEEF